MSTGFLLILVLVLSIGALLAAWAGIRSIQSARSVVFYRTRQARMTTGRQWLALSLALVVFAVGSLFFGKPLIGQILTPAAVPTTSPVQTLTLTPSPSQTDTTVPIATFTQSASATITSTTSSTVTAPATPSRTPSYLGTYTAFAVWTERRSTFIAMLSFTPTASRTPIPTWTRTPSSTPRPTYTASATHTPRPTWTPSLTLTPRPTDTTTSTSTRTRTPTRTVTPTP